MKPAQLVHEETAQHSHVIILNLRNTPVYSYSQHQKMRQAVLCNYGMLPLLPVAASDGMAGLPCCLIAKLACTPVAALIL